MSHNNTARHYIARMVKIIEEGNEGMCDLKKKQIHLK